MIRFDAKSQNYRLSIGNGRGAILGRAADVYDPVIVRRRVAVVGLTLPTSINPSTWQPFADLLLDLAIAAPSAEDLAEGLEAFIGSVPPQPADETLSSGWLVERLWPREGKPCGDGVAVANNYGSQQPFMILAAFQEFLASLGIEADEGSVADFLTDLGWSPFWTAGKVNGNRITLHCWQGPSGIPIEANER